MGAPIIRIIIFEGPYWATSILGNYQISIEKGYPGFPKWEFPKVRSTFRGGYRDSTGIYRGYVGFRVSQIWSTILGAPHNQNYLIWGSLLKYPNFGKLPNIHNKGSL